MPEKYETSDKVHYKNHKKMKENSSSYYEGLYSH